MGSYGVRTSHATTRTHVGGAHTSPQLSCDRTTYETLTSPLSSVFTALATTFYSVLDITVYRTRYDHLGAPLSQRSPPRLQYKRICVGVCLYYPTPHAPYARMQGHESSIAHVNLMSRLQPIVQRMSIFHLVSRSHLPRRVTAPRIHTTYEPPRSPSYPSPRGYYPPAGLHTAYALSYSPHSYCAVQGAHTAPSVVRTLMSYRR
jgi:hypothetical protein